MAKKKAAAGMTHTVEDSIIADVLSSRKYRGLGIPEATLADLIKHAQAQATDPRDIEHIVREKMHHLIAPYLGDPDYAACRSALDAAFQSGEPEEVKTVCRKILSAHASTRERLPIMEGFYERLFAYTGRPHIILDLACGLHPFSLPWMDLSPDAQYYAYDLHQPRLDAINHFLTLSGLPALAIKQDILIDPPTLKADVAFFFKEAHRFEQRRHGCNREFWQRINAKFLLVSLPTASLTGRHAKSDQHRRLVAESITGLPWQVKEIEFENEIVFCIEKDV